MIFLYIIRAVGAGDVKLLAVIGMLTGLDFCTAAYGCISYYGLFTGIVRLFLKRPRGQYGEQWNKGAWVSLCSGVPAGYVVVLVYRCCVVFYE